MRRAFLSFETALPNFWPALRVFLAAGALVMGFAPVRIASAAAPAAAPTAVPPAAGAAAAAPSALKAIVEVDREAYYTGDPVPVRISVWNDGNVPASAPGGAVEAGFEMHDVDGKVVVPAPGSAVPSAGAETAGAVAGDGPKTLQPGGFFGFARDLTTLYPRLKQVGTYRLQWRSGALVSNAVILRVVPRYDPGKDYVARVETDVGAFTIEFLRKDAPIAVKTFVELASTGFYDGVIFHYVEPGRIVASGDPTGTGRGGPGFTIPAEHPQVKMLAGTVLMKPGGQPPGNGSIFEILLAPRADYEGAMTGFGQVVSGLEVVARISSVPAAPRGTPNAHHPVKDVHITKITIAPKGA